MFSEPKWDGKNGIPPAYRLPTSRKIWYRGPRSWQVNEVEQARKFMGEAEKIVNEVGTGGNLAAN